MTNAEKTETNILEPIALVGIGCRLPGGGNDPESFWNMLINKVDAITEVPEDRWNLSNFFSEDKSAPGKTYTRHGGFINDMDKFEPEFFGISPREAACMDPQQRILLETTTEAFADAGIDPKDFRGKSVGVFIGIFTHEYNNLLLDSANRELIDTHTGVGASSSIVANRISYIFDFIGPSLTLDTACSSSMVSMHLACQSIHNGESEIAIAGGANIILKPEITISTAKASMLSPDGRCKSFDASANGYVRSEGVGALLLKPLSKALEDGDDVYAVINSTVVNQDGKSDGITVPNRESQIKALRKAIKKSGVDSRDIFYAEAHGTGTFVGDPIEANSIGTVLSEGRDTPLLIGSVKSNVGHLEAASGIASVVKVAMALKNKQIPPNIHFNTPNPNIAFGRLKMRVPTAVEEWKVPAGKVRRACINSFGFGGTNASVVISEAPAQKAPDQKASDNNSSSPEALPACLPLSATKQKSLREVVKNFRELLLNDEVALQNIIYSASVRSTHYQNRVAFVAENKNALIDLMDQYLDGQESPFIIQNKNAYSGKKLAFVFAGMGTQWWAMGRQLFNESSYARSIIEDCDKRLENLSGWSILDELLRDEQDSNINKTQFAQPAIFIVEVALAKLWLSWGIQPDLICGHSVGEVAAAYISGALSLDDALTVVYHRSRLQQTTAGMGGMLAAAISREQAAEFIAGNEDKVSIAAINSPVSLTLAGDSAVLADLEKQLTDRKIFCRPLTVEVPYHCVVMDILEDEIRDALQFLTPTETTIPLYSTVTGKRISGTTLDAEYWWSNVRQPVQFSETISSMVDAVEGDDAGAAEVFLEVSSHPVLIQSMKECLQSQTPFLTLGSIKRKQDEILSLSQTIGELYTYGYPLNWKAFVSGSVVKLPRYPWQKTSYWRESDISKMDRIGSHAIRTQVVKDEHPLLGARLDLASRDSVWENQLNYDNLTYLQGHKIQDSMIFPAAGYVEMAITAASKKASQQIEIENISLIQALTYQNTPTRTQFVLSDNTFSIFSEKQKKNAVSDWALLASGSVSVKAGLNGEKQAPLMLITSPESCSLNVDSDELYQQFSAVGLNYFDEFRKIVDFKRNATDSISQIEISHANAAPYSLYPPLLDNGFQSLLGIVIHQLAENDEELVVLPTQIEKITFHPAFEIASMAEAPVITCHSQIDTLDNQQLSGNIAFYGEDGTLLLEVTGLRCILLAKKKWDMLAQNNDNNNFSNWFTEVHWEKASPLDDDQEIDTKITSKSWLIFDDISGLGKELSGKLGDNSRLVSLDTFDQFDGPDLKLAISAFIQEIVEHQKITDILYLWPLDIAPLNESGNASCGTDSLLYIIQALNEIQATPALTLVTRGGQVVSSVSLNPEQSALWGMMQVLTLEQPQIHCKCVDLSPEGNIDQDVSSLLQCVQIANNENHIAFRNGEMFVQRLKPSQFELDDYTPVYEEASETKPAHDLEGSWFITGGFGGLGKLLARRLVSIGVKNLVLMGRKGALGNEELIEEFSANGVHVLAVKGDVSSYDDLQRIFLEIDEKMPSLQGVVHAAGVLDDGIIAQQTPQRFEKIMSPKVLGSWNLHQLTLDRQLDSFILFSSVASLIGSPGQSNYASGNAFMDNLARLRQSLGLPGMAINWGPWAGDGMAENLLERLESKGFKAVDEETGLNVFQQLILEDEIPQIGVAPIHWEAFFSTFSQGNAAFYEHFAVDHASTETQQADFYAQLKPLNEAEKETFLMDHVDATVSSVLGIQLTSEEERQTLLKDYGLDSLMSLEIVTKLEKSLGIPLPPTLLFEYPSIQTLGGYLLEQLLESNQETNTTVTDSSDEADINDALDGLTDEELDSLLSELAD